MPGVEQQHSGGGGIRDPRLVGTVLTGPTED